MTSPELQDLRSSQDRNYAAEGIPMVLSLVSEVAPIPDPTDPVRAEGIELAARIERYRAAIAAGQRDADTGVTISVLQAVSYADFDAGAHR